MQGEQEIEMTEKPYSQALRSSELPSKEKTDLGTHKHSLHRSFWEHRGRKCLIPLASKNASQRWGW